MSFLKTVFRISAQNFRKWQSDYRIWTIAFFLVILIFMYAEDFRALARFLDCKAPVWIFPFLYTKSGAKILFTLPVILLFCDAPFVDGNQLFVIIRTSRAKWLCGQILYIISASFAYYFFIFAASFLAMFFGGELSPEWGRALTAAAYDSSILGAAEVYSLNVSRMTVEFFTPLLACFYTFVMSWLSAVFLGLLIFACNLISGSRALGISASSFFVVLTLIAKLYKRLDRLSPITWSTLDGIDVAGLTPRPPVAYCLGAYAALMIGLAAVIIPCGKRSPLTAD